MKKIFLEWLKDLELLENYRNNWKNGNPRDYNSKKIGNPYLYINNAFFWNKTPESEGFRFWRNIDENWQLYLKIKKRRKS